MKSTLSLLALVALTVPAATTAQYLVGDVVADFTLTDLEGESVSLYDHQGEIIVLNFFTTWCPGCNEEAALLQELVWEAYQNAEVAVIAIDLSAWSRPSWPRTRCPQPERPGAG